METYNYVVYTYRGGTGGYDHGAWTGHSSKAEAIDCAVTVEGYAYKIKRKDNGTFSMKPIQTMRKV